MARVTVTIVCRQRWWLKYYLFGVLVMAHAAGRAPDPNRLAYWIGRGMKVEAQ